MAQHKRCGCDVGADGELIINPDKAAVVCWIFDHYRSDGSVSFAWTSSAFSLSSFASFGSCMAPHLAAITPGGSSGWPAEEFEKLFPNALSAVIDCGLGAAAPPPNLRIAEIVQNVGREPLSLGGGAQGQHRQNSIQCFLPARPVPPGERSRPERPGKRLRTRHTHARPNAAAPGVTIHCLHDGFFLLPPCGSFTYYVLSAKRTGHLLVGKVCMRVKKSCSLPLLK